MAKPVFKTTLTGSFDLNFDDLFVTCMNNIELQRLKVEKNNKLKNGLGNNVSPTSASSDLIDFLTEL